MARPRNIVPGVATKVYFPTDLLATVNFALWSTVEGRVPYGAFNRLIVRLLREHVERCQREGRPIDWQG